jgi:hypothetical protein
VTSFKPNRVYVNALKHDPAVLCITKVARLGLG